MCSSGSHSFSILLRRQQALSELRPLSVQRRLISLVYSRGFQRSQVQFLLRLLSQFVLLYECGSVVFCGLLNPMMLATDDVQG